MTPPYEFKALGWIWELAPEKGPPVMVCAADKFAFVCRQLKKWSTAKRLSIRALESLVGILRWLSSGFRIGLSHLAYIVAEVAKHKGKATRIRARSPHQRMFERLYEVGPEAATAIRFWARFFPTWDGRCPVFLDFGPTATWEVIGRVDASTEWGCGGWMWIRGSPTVFAFKHKWTEKEKKRAWVKTRMSTTVLEAIGTELWMRAFGRRCEGKRVLLEGENETVARAVARSYSRKKEVMLCVHGICQSAARHSICLRSRAILGGHFNKIADCLSHNRVEEAQRWAREELCRSLSLLQ
jgi:hypothetical protein